MKTEEMEKWIDFNKKLNKSYLEETGNERIDISRIDCFRFIAWLRVQLFKARDRDKYYEQIINKLKQ